jgi:hypothetical protein
MKAAVVELVVAIPHVTFVSKPLVVQLGSLVGSVALPTVMVRVMDDAV